MRHEVLHHRGHAALHRQARHVGRNHAPEVAQDRQSENTDLEVVLQVKKVRARDTPDPDPDRHPGRRARRERSRKKLH